MKSGPRGATTRARARRGEVAAPEAASEPAPAPEPEPEPELLPSAPYNGFAAAEYGGETCHEPSLLGALLFLGGLLAAVLVAAFLFS